MDAYDDDTGIHVFIYYFIKQMINLKISILILSK